MKLVLAEKPSVAQSIAKVLGAAKREDGYLEGNGYVVSWCVGHLVELAQPEVYDAKYSKWAYADLPIFPMDWQYEVSAGTKKQFGILKKLMAREDVASLVCATDAGREGELIFRLVYHKAGCILGNLLTNVVSYVIGLLLLVIGGSAIYCIVKALWQSLLILVVLGIATIAAVFLLVWAVMKVENIGESLGAFIRS